jgi:DNA ligase-1
MRRFAETCEAVAAATGKNEKVRLAGEYLHSLHPDDAAAAAVFFTGRPFPRRREETLSIGGSLLAQAVRELAAASANEMSAAYRRHGDLGGMAEELFTEKEREPQEQPISLAEFRELLEQLAARRGPSRKLPLLKGLLERASPLEAKYIVKIITGDLRIGMRESLVEEAIAGGFQQPLQQVQRANILLGDIGETLRQAVAGRLGSARFALFHPIGFMLATPAETAVAAIAPFTAGAQVEDKYDGIRAQAHKAIAGVKLFSRTLDEIPEFPELGAPLARLPGEFILDGEIVAWRASRALPFTELQKRLGRLQPTLFIDDAVPVSYLAFDLIYQDGELLLDVPLAERRRRLEALLGTGSGAPLVQLAPARILSSVEEAQREFEAALARGNEGIMAKAPDSPYAPGRRGQYWRKLKAPLATLDVVVVAAEWGHGKRRKVLSDYTFAVRDGNRLATIGKAFSGLTDAEIEQYTRFFLEHTTEDQGYRRLVEPLVVIEVAFNNIQRSSRHDSGFALRFPRIVRLRPDKPIAEIDTLDRVRQLFEQQAATALG